MADRFGIPRDRFSDYLLLRQKQSWFLLRSNPFIPSVGQLKISQAGLKAFRRVGDYIKPTTRIIQGFGRWASRSKLRIGPTELEALLAGEKIHVDMPIENGYVILVMGKDNILGLGLYVHGRISSQLPRKEIRSAMI